MTGQDLFDHLDGIAPAYISLRGAVHLPGDLAKVAVLQAAFVVNAVFVHIDQVIHVAKQLFAVGFCEAVYLVSGKYRVDVIDIKTLGEQCLGQTGIEYFGKGVGIGFF